MSRDKLQYILKEIYNFLTNKKFILNVAGIFLFLSVTIWAVLTWLSAYTNHGQKLEMPNYMGTPLVDAQQSAHERTFQIIVNDSVHIVGKAGGLIQNQNPRPGSLVKENRKIYVTTTKYKADEVDISGLTLYGQGYEMMQAALQSKGVRAKVKGYRYDRYTNNTILEVWQNGKIIISQRLNPKQLKLAKGSELEFILSTQEGGSEVVQNLIGKTVNTARFIPQYLTLNIANAGDFHPDELEKAIITSQSPEADGSTSLSHGSTIQVRVRAHEN